MENPFLVFKATHKPVLVYSGENDLVATLYDFPYLFSGTPEFARPLVTWLIDNMYSVKDGLIFIPRGNFEWKEGVKFLIAKSILAPSAISNSYWVNHAVIGYLPQLGDSQLPEGCHNRDYSYLNRPTSLYCPSNSVYLICNSTYTHCKIGVTNDPQRRLNDLQTAHYDTLILIGVREGGRDLEQALHKALVSYHARGEWFNYSDKDYINTVFNTLSIKKA